MKKVLLLGLTLILSFQISVYAASSSGGFLELSAGKIKVKGESIGVIVLSPLSFTYDVGVKAIKMPDSSLSQCIIHELINKGAKVMVMNAPGMEQIISQFISVPIRGKFDTKELISSTADVTLSSILKNAKDTPDSLALIDKLLSVNELTGENDRVGNYESFYKKVLALWGVKKIITIQSAGAFNCVVKGYEIDGPTSSLVFQYEVRSDLISWAASFPIKFDEKWKSEGYFVIDNPTAKYEESYKRIIELAKRISEFFDVSGK